MRQTKIETNVAEKSNGLLYLSRREVEDLSDSLNILELVREVFRLHALNDVVLPDEAYLAWSHSGDNLRSIAMPGYVGGAFQAAGAKIINANPSNPARGVDRAAGLSLLFDTATAAPIAMMDAAHISATRTAAVSLLSADLLAPPAPHRLAIIGAGPIARAHIRAFLDHFDTIEEVVIYDFDEDRVLGCIEACAKGRRSRLVAASSPEEAVRSSNIIVTATTTTTGYIPFGWLARGSLLVNVSLDDAMPDVFMRADKVFVDDWELVRSSQRRLLGRMIADGRVVRRGPTVDGRRAITGELREIVIGSLPGRERADERIVVNPFGLSLSDVAFMARIYDAARRTGTGTTLPI